MSALQQNSPEWLEWRKDKIGASDAPCIMGVGFKTPRQLWLSKKGMLEDEDNVWMKRGRDMEKEALEAFEQETGLLMFPLVMTSKIWPWQTASMDGITLMRDVAVEIKCPGKKDHCLALGGKIPEKYIPQLQHQMSVTNLDRIYYYSYDGSEGVLIEEKCDYKYTEKLIKKEREFFEMLMNDVMPPLSDKDYRKREDENWFTLERDWAASYYDLQKAKENEVKLRAAVIEGSGGQSCFGKLIKATKFTEKGRVNYNSIPELKGINLDQFRGGSTERWRLSLRK